MSTFNKRGLSRILVVAGFFSTMPGHSMLQAAIGVESFESHSFSPIGNNSSLVYYGDSLLFSLLAMMAWWCAVGYSWGSQLKRTTECLLNGCILLLLMLGKAVDLIWEGRLFTGNYWLLACVAIIFLMVRLARPLDKLENKDSVAVS